MSTNNPEQPYNPEQDTSQEVDFQTEQELTPEQKGLQLAAQIKDLRAKAKTEADFKLIQEKLDELSNLFETEPNSYRDFDDVIKDLGNGIGWNMENNISWITTAFNIKGHNTDYISMGYTFSQGEIAKVDFNISPPNELVEKGMDSNNRSTSQVYAGFNDLKKFLNGRKVKSYAITNSAGRKTWYLEVEPKEEYDEVRNIDEVVHEITRSILNFTSPSKLSWSRYGNDRDGFIIDLGHIDEVDVAGVKFNEPIPEMVKNQKFFMGQNVIINNGLGIEELKRRFGINKVKSYYYDGEWYLVEEK